MSFSAFRFAALAVGLLVSVVRADGLIIVPEPGPGPTPGDHAFAPLEVKRHHVEVEIDGQLARTRVDQVFANPTGRRLEGTYLFPLPEGARIDAFRMTIGGESVEAELVDAAKARRIYERIVRRQKDPALLEYVGRGALKVRIFPIEAHDEKRVELRYTELLEADGGLVDYTYPLAIERFSSAPIESLSLRCRIEADHALKTLYSPTHRVEIAREGEKRAVVGFEKRGVRPETDFRLVYAAPEAPEHGVALNLVTHRGPGDEAGFYMLLAAPGTGVTGDAIAAKDVVFAVDTSGSMRGEKIARARRALRFCVERLNGADRFEIVRFSTEAEALFGGLAPVGKESRSRAKRFVDAFDAVGGTAMHAALTKAADAVRARKEGGKRPAMVVFLTDGRPTIGEMGEDAIVKAVGGAGGARVFPFGIGTDIHTRLLDRIAGRTGGFTQYVMPGERIDEKLASFARRIAHPVLTDLAVGVSGAVRLNRPTPRNLGALFRGEQLVRFGRYRGHGDAAVTLEGKVNGERVAITRELRFPERRKANAFVARLWATRRVGFLLDQIRLHGESDELREEVVRLARRYGIVTPYTSYLILEDERRRDVAPAERTVEGAARPADADDAAWEKRVDRARQHFERMKREVTGESAVRGARSAKSLREAERVDAPAAAAREAGAGDGLFGADDGAARRPEQARKFAGGRAFYRRGDRWIDATVPEHPDAERVELEMGSDRYFALLEKHPEARVWLSVGRKLTVRVGETIYVIR